jgi:hypothetical protein
MTSCGVIARSAGPVAGRPTDKLRKAISPKSVVMWLWAWLCQKKAGTIAGTVDIAGNFAKIVGYCRCFGAASENAGNLKLKSNKFN